MVRWVLRNLSTLLLAFILALVVWVSAVLSTDPNQQAVYQRPVALELINQDPADLQMAELPEQVRITINAPRSIWERLNNNPSYVRAWIDLSGLEKGEYIRPVVAQISINPARIVRIEPDEVRVVLEPLVTRTLSLKLDVSGEPALGYRSGTVEVEPVRVNVSGPETLVGRITEARVALDISDATDNVRRSVSVQVVDEKGASVQGVTVSPAAVTIDQQINLQGGYRNVVVKVITIGQVAEGYWLTNMSVAPPNVTVFSANPRQVNELPGFVETQPIDLNGLNDDLDIRTALNLPEGVSLAGEESVLVRLSIAALEGSLPITLPMGLIGLPPEYAAQIAPDSVSVLLTGPLPLLNNLNPAGIRVSINVSGLEPGVYQLRPVVDLLPPQVQVGSIQPAEVQVSIDLAPTPSPGGMSPIGTPTVVSASPTPTSTAQP
jgi:YbbR domain-containing protein